MNDFETRARAAGRAVRDAVGDSTAVAITPRKSRGPIRALAVAAIVTAIAVVGTTLVVNNRADGPTAAEVAAFCNELQHAGGSSQEPGQTLPAIESAPSEIRAGYKALRDFVRTGPLHTRSDGNPSDQLISVMRFENWFQINCVPEAAQPDATPKWQRFGPVGSDHGITVCGVRNSHAPPEPGMADTSTITIYGDGTLADPYNGPLVGLTANNDLILGTADAVASIELPGGPSGAEVSAMADPFENPVPDGRAIQWGDAAANYFAIAGRRITGDVDGMLARLAGRVTFAAGTATIPSEALPAGWRVLYSGPSAAVNPSGRFAQQTFSVTANHAALYLVGTILAPQAAEALRFLIPNLQTGSVDGHTAFVSPETAPDGRPLVKSVGRWVDGAVTLTVIRTQTKGASVPTIEQFIRATKKLTRSEWESLVTEASTCYFPLIAPGKASGSATPPGGP